MGALPTSMYMYHVYAEAKKRESDQGWSYTQLYIVLWVLGLEPDSLKEQLSVITESLQPWRCWQNYS